MRHATKTIAGVEVIPLCDAVGAMGPALRRPLDETFFGASPADWAGLDRDEWILHFHSYVLRDPGGQAVLVDTGIGGTDSPAAGWAPVPGGLLAELAAAGMAVDDIDVVVLTHLHSDHVGGSVTAGAPAFPQARYVLQQDELDWITAAPNPVRDLIVRPLRDRLQIVSGAVPLTSAIAIVPTPGHTPGHQSVRVGSLVLSGDVVVHPVQLANPAVTYAHDEDPERAAQTRTDLLDRISAEAGVIATSHLPEPFIPLG